MIKDFGKNKNYINMKALSVKQPWASLLVSGVKDVENRTRRTNFRGRVLIHASKIGSNPMITKKQLDAIREYNEMSGSRYYYQKGGCIIGSVEIYDCVQNDPSIWAESGAWNWKVRDPILYNNPIPVKGMLGFFNYDGPIEEEISD